MRTLEESLNLLLESMTSTVYHTTSLESLVKLLESNSFRLSVSKYSALEKHPVDTSKYQYYMSTARSASSSYVQGGIRSGIRVVIEFDGAKLSQNFKGKAVDWYAGKDPEEYGQRQDELEDRLYSSKPEIIDIKKYIKSVHMLRETINRDSGKPFEKLKKIERSFPIYIYNKKTDMNFLRTNKAERI